MRVLIVGDVHFKDYTSIVRKRGTAYSRRLENCINSINWAEEQAEHYKCDRVVYLGDFFDQPDLNSEEVTALKEIQWCEVPHQVIVGNHELGRADGSYSTAQLFNLLPNFEVVDKPKLEVGFGYYFLYLPYIFEKDRKTAKEYFNECFGEHSFTTQEVKHTFIFSHNDLKGINYGVFVSKEGFEVEDLKRTCAVCFNGHIHNNSEVVPDRIINVGNLTGQNFNEDAARYEHRIYVLDIRGSDYQVYAAVNPYAYNFYKIEIKDENSLSQLSNLKPHSIVSVKGIEHLVPKVKELLEEDTRVEEYRVITVIEDRETPEETVSQLVTVDHLQQFRDYIIEKLGTGNGVLKELQEVLSSAD